MQNTDGYLDAFMNGFDFVLLAMRGRIETEDLTKEDRARLQTFINEYSRVAEAYRNRTPATTTLHIEGRIRAEMEPLAAN